MTDPTVAVRPGPRRRVLTYERAFVEARGMFVRSGALDMDELARTLSVGRATLYRVVGNRDRLLGDVLWSLAVHTIGRAAGEANGVGVERVIDMGSRYASAILAFEPFRRFVRSEPLTAFRVLFTPSGHVLERSVTAWREIIEREVASGALVLPFDIDLFSYVLVRTWESMLYSDLLGGIEPDLEKAAIVARALFRSPSA